MTLAGEQAAAHGSSHDRPARRPASLKPAPGTCPSGYTCLIAHARPDPFDKEMSPC